MIYSRMIETFTYFMIYDERMLSRKLKIRQPNFLIPYIDSLIKIPEPVNTVIAAIVVPAQTTLKYFVVSVLYHNLACQFPFQF